MQVSANKQIRRKSKSNKDYSITFMIIPYSQKNIYRVTLNNNHLYFFILIVITILLFSIFSSMLNHKNNLVKEEYTQNYNMLYNKILNLQHGIKSINDKLYLLQITGNDLYYNIWNETSQKKITPNRSIDTMNNTLLNAIETLNPALELLITREQAFQNLPLGWPIEKGIITSEFGGRISPFGYSKDFHTGYDFANNIGTPILATADGEVVYATEGNSGYGNHVRILHAHGFITLYGHASALKVTKGQFVRKGDVIALLGESGSATGPHCHYEVRLQNYDMVNSSFEIFLNPLPYIVEKDIF